jgi:hypothetical protein
MSRADGFAFSPTSNPRAPRIARTRSLPVVGPTLDDRRISAGQLQDLLDAVEQRFGRAETGLNQG